MSRPRTLLALFSVVAAWGQDSFEDLFNRGYDHFRNQQYAEAEPLLRRAAQAKQKDFNTLYLLGVTCQKLGQADAALLAWRDALAVQPANVRRGKHAVNQFLIRGQRCGH